VWWARAWLMVCVFQSEQYGIPKQPRRSHGPFKRRINILTLKNSSYLDVFPYKTPYSLKTSDHPPVGICTIFPHTKFTEAGPKGPGSTDDSRQGLRRPTRVARPKRSQTDSHLDTHTPGKLVAKESTRSSQGKTYQRYQVMEYTSVPP